MIKYFFSMYQYYDISKVYQIVDLRKLIHKH
jgi:hypothetical protein